MNNSMALVAAVRSQMVLKGIRHYTDLAKRAGLNRRVLYHWIAFPHNTETLDSVAAALGTTAADILTERDRLMGATDAD